MKARCTPGTDPGPPAPGTVLSAFCTPRRSLIGSGAAIVVDIPAPWPEHVQMVSDALASLESHDELNVPGSGPVAFAALPFDTASPARFVVPEVVHGSDAEGQRWVTVIGEGGPRATTSPGGTTGHSRAAADTMAQQPRVLQPREICVRGVVDPVVWCDAVSEARRRIEAGAITKVVLSRQIVVDADVAFDAATVFVRLRATYPDSLCFSVDDFVGASPELLVSRIGEVVRAHPMAGTTPRSGDPTIDQQAAAGLLGSDKNRTEHQITIDMVHDALLPWCSYLDAEPVPSVVRAGPVQHLATLVEGRLSQPSPSVLDLVATLHPTPAVGGWPRDEALATISELEPSPRGRYAGPVGWVDSRGNGAFAVAVRSAQLSGARASMFAGVGIVADSDPVSELEETRVKSRALLDVLVRV